MCSQNELGIRYLDKCNKIRHTVNMWPTTVTNENLCPSLTTQLYLINNANCRLNVTCNNLHIFAHIFPSHDWTLNKTGIFYPNIGIPNPWITITSDVQTIFLIYLMIYMLYTLSIMLFMHWLLIFYFKLCQLWTDHMSGNRSRLRKRKNR